MLFSRLSAPISRSAEPIISICSWQLGNVFNLGLHVNVASTIGKLEVVLKAQNVTRTRYRETICPSPMVVRRWHIDSPPIRPLWIQKLAADLRPSADGSAVRTSGGS